MSVIARRERRWWLTVWDDGYARDVYNHKPHDRPTRKVEVVEVVPADQLAGAVAEREELRARVAALDAEIGRYRARAVRAEWDAEQLRLPGGQ